MRAIVITAVLEDLKALRGILGVCNNSLIDLKYEVRGEDSDTKNKIARYDEDYQRLVRSVSGLITFLE